MALVSDKLAAQVPAEFKARVRAEIAEADRRALETLGSRRRIVPRVRDWGGFDDLMRRVLSVPSYRDVPNVGKAG